MKVFSNEICFWSHHIFLRIGSTDVYFWSQYIYRVMVFQVQEKILLGYQEVQGIILCEKGCPEETVY